MQTKAQAQMERLAAPDNLASLPDLIRTEAELDNVLTQPSAKLAEFIRTVASPLVILGAGGKMGPTLAVLARRAAEVAGHPLEVVAVSRFGNQGARHWLESRGVKTMSCDLLAADSLAHLPDTTNLIYLVGLKFGTAQNPAATWAINTLAPARVVERYPTARMVALSTGNVYPLTPISHGGAKETESLTPLGEYGNAAVARERIFDYCSAKTGASVAMIRLFYAVDLRYGVLVDIARRVAQGEQIELANAALNCIWQGDANEMILRALPLAGTPPTAWNLCQPEIFSVRKLANELGSLLGREPNFTENEGPTALLGDSAKICAALGRPNTPMLTLLRWTAHWVRSGGHLLEKPTHFEVRDGKY